MSYPDTALESGPVFTFIWGVQSALVYYGFGLKWAMAYLVALMISITLAVKMRGRHGQNLEDARVFFTLMRENDLNDTCLKSGTILQFSSRNCYDWPDK
ncbi:MAG: hypothetical protein GY697_10290 [Desulfobacterales bacterium]|nr:hypothetical protein [Desulfobacterales bacterium]